MNLLLLFPSAAVTTLQSVSVIFTYWSCQSSYCVRVCARARVCRRQWLVVTEDGHMVTGRQEPRLVLVLLSCGDGRVCLSGPDMEDLHFPIRQPDNPVIDCR